MRLIACLLICLLVQAGCSRPLASLKKRIPYKVHLVDRHVQLVLGETTIDFKDLRSPFPIQKEGELVVGGQGTAVANSIVDQSEQKFSFKFHYAYEDGIGKLSINEYRLELRNDGELLVFGDREIPLNERAEVFVVTEGEIRSATDAVSNESGQEKVKTNE